MVACSLSQFGGNCSSSPTSWAACMTCPWPLVTKESTSCVARRKSKPSTIAAPPKIATSPVTRRTRRISPNRTSALCICSFSICYWSASEIPNIIATACGANALVRGRPTGRPLRHGRRLTNSTERSGRGRPARARGPATQRKHNRHSLCRTTLVLQGTTHVSSSKVSAP